MAETAKQENAKAITQARQTFSLTPSTLDEAMRFSQMIATSDVCPKDFKNNAGNVLVAVQMGAEVGLQPMQALQNIAVINGRPCVWGDAIPALAKAHPKFEYMHEQFDDVTMTATCRVKRKGEPEQAKTFSQADAQQAGLWNKQGTWQTYPKRMLQMRARAWAIRDVFPDALRGIQVAEEVMDIPTKEMGPAEVVPAEAAPVELPPYSAESFEKNLPAWRKAIADGKRTAQQIIDMVSTKGVLTDQQKAEIKAVSKTGKDEFIEDYERTENAQEAKQK
jgi:hypothetical protein